VLSRLGPTVEKGEKVRYYHRGGGKGKGKEKRNTPFVDRGGGSLRLHSGDEGQEREGAHTGAVHGPGGRKGGEGGLSMDAK